jgi:branched-subunit amino acid aminotransferase/4-amino-4-deoxychorismate lyase
MAYVIFNQLLLKEKEIRISPQDRGFRYGDGVFDTMIARNKKLYQFDWHMNRLARALHEVKIQFEVEELENLCQKLLIANDFANGLLRIQITRGIGGRGYLPENDSKPTLLIETITAPEVIKSPISLWQGSYRKISPQALPVRFKLCQGLNSTLARMEAVENNCFDALMLDENNHISETSSANIFWFTGGELYTPALSCGALEGSIRAAIMRLSPYKINEVSANIELLQNAEAVFITNVAWKTLAVSGLEPIGKKWESGKLSEQIFNLLEEDIKQLE